MYQKRSRMNSGRAIRSTMWSRLAMFSALAGSFWLGSAGPIAANKGGNDVPNELRARRFVVVDDAGKERGEFGIAPNGRPKLQLWDDANTIAALLEMDGDGMPRLAFEKTDGTPLAELGVLDGRNPLFVLRDAVGRRRIGLVVAGGDSVAIGLYDTKETARCSVVLTPDGQPQVTLKGKRGAARASLLLDGADTSALVLFDANGRERVVFQVEPKVHADAAVFGPDGKAIWSAARSP